MGDENSMVCAERMIPMNDASVLGVSLDEAGVEHFFEGQNAGNALTHLGTVLTSVSLHTRADQCAQARQVIQEFYDRRKAQTLAEERTCPECGCTEGKRTRKTFFWLLLLCLTAGFAGMYLGRQYRCPQCQATWSHR